MMETAAEPMRCPRQCGLDIALADANSPMTLVLNCSCSKRRAGFQRLSGSTTAGSGSRSSVTRSAASSADIGFREDDGDRLADKTHLVGGKQGLLRVEER